MKLHERVKIYNKARGELSDFFLNLEEIHDLTYGELYGLLIDQMQSLNRTHIRNERHPDNPDMPGGLADEEATPPARPAPPSASSTAAPTTPHRRG